MQYRLNHVCNKPGCVGLPGDVIDVSPEDAAWLDARGGGKRIDLPPEPAPSVAEPTPEPRQPRSRRRNTLESA